MSANFIKLTTTEKLDELFEQSNEQPVVLFKHSTTCPISTGVYDEVSKYDGDVNLIVMQSARDISQALAERTGVRHESPQALVIKDGKAVYQASHYDVTAEDLKLATGKI